MRRTLKPLVCTVLGLWMRKVPLARWPAWAANLYNIKVPRNVRPNCRSAPSGGANINILLELMELVRPLTGDFAECGVFRGSTLISVALHARITDWRAKVIGFDSFAGFDDSILVDLELGGAEDTEKRRGGFDGTSLDYVAARVAALGLSDTIELKQGYFETTLPKSTERLYRLVHLDCDIYTSYKQCLDYFYPRMVRGGVILLDEYNDPPWPGCNQAVDEFLLGRAERLMLIARDGYEKYYIVKD